jgi:ferredoxin
MKVKVDRNLCIGAASCVVIAPKVFQLDAEAKAEVVDEKGADDATILDAAKSCPVLAIIIEDDDGNQIWPET